jgi:hypothetical protein
MTEKDLESDFSLLDSDLDLTFMQRRTWTWNQWTQTGLGPLDLDLGPLDLDSDLT